MSSTALTIIKGAYREGNLIPVGSTPTTSEQAESLAMLTRLIASVFGEEMGEHLQDWPIPLPQRTAPLAANLPQLPYPMGLDGNLYGVPPAVIANEFAFYPPKNSRIVFGGLTNRAYFPEAPDDGSRMAIVQGSGAGDSGTVGQVLTLDGNGRTIQGANTQTFTFASPATAGKAWLYRADLADWTLVADLATVNDTIAFPTDLDDLWITMLIKRLAPSYGKVISEQTEQTYTRMMHRLKAKYRQAGTTIYKATDVPNTRQSYAGNPWGWQ